MAQRKLVPIRMFTREMHTLEVWNHISDQIRATKNFIKIELARHLSAQGMINENIGPTKTRW